MGYYSINTLTVKSYELKTIEADSAECKLYEVLDNFISPDQWFRGKMFYQSDIGTLIERQRWLDADADTRVYYDTVYGGGDPSSPNYNPYFMTPAGMSETRFMITPNGALQDGFYQQSRQWEAMHYDRFDPAGDTNFGYSVTLAEDLQNYETGCTIFFRQLGDDKVAQFDYDVTMAVASSIASFGFIAAVHRYNKSTIDISPNQPTTGYWETVWIPGRTVPRYGRQDETGDGLNIASYPFQPYDNRCIIGIRGIPLKNLTGVANGNKEYRFDVTAALNALIDTAPAGTFLSKTDEFMQPIPRYFTKPKYDSNGLLLGYEFKLRAVVQGTDIKVYFQDLLVLHVEREEPVNNGFDWHPAVCSPTTNSYITNYYFKIT